MNREQEIQLKLNDVAATWFRFAMLTAGPAILLLSALDFVVTRENFEFFFYLRLSIAILFISKYYLAGIYRKGWQVSGLYVTAMIEVSIMVNVMIWKFGGHISPYVWGNMISAIYIAGLPIAFRVPAATGVGVLMVYIVPILLYDDITNPSHFISVVVLFSICVFLILFLTWFLGQNMRKQLTLQKELEDKSNELKMYTEHLEDVVEEKTRELSGAQRIKSVATLARGFAHDFNNVLSSIRAFTDMVAYKKDYPDELRKDIKIVDHEINKGNRIINRLTSLRTDMELNKTNADITGVLKGMVNMTKATAGDSIIIEESYESAIGEISADKDLLEEAFSNIFLNARDAMPHGGTLNVSARLLPGDELKETEGDASSKREYVHISFQDTGHGINKKDLPHVFDPFYTTKDKGAGTGLGLAMVFSIIKAHGGFINVQSEEEVGTTLNVYLPA